eukprot:568995-Alexandrium_andersonii.AAC.1
MHSCINSQRAVLSALLVPHGTRLDLELLLLRLLDPLLPGGERLELGEPLEVLVVAQDVLDIAPPGEHREL